MDEKNNLIVSQPLDKQTSEIAEKILNETDIDKVRDLTHLFNLNMSKKNALRVITMNGLLDKITNQMVSRFERFPDNFSNADLLNYLQVTQTSIEKASKSLNLIDESPTIQYNQNNQVNVNIIDNFDRESKERIAEAIKAILSKASAEPDEDVVEIVEENIGDENDTE